MRITRVISFLAAVSVAVVAAPGGRVQPPPPPKPSPAPGNGQTGTFAPCIDGSTPYCCSASEDNVSYVPLSDSCDSIWIACCIKNETVSKPSLK